MIFRERLRFDMHKWPGIMEGHPAFILGNGPSLAPNDLNLVQGYFSIGINRIFKVFDPILLFWQDKELVAQHEAEIDRCPAVKVCRNTSDRMGKYNNYRLVDGRYTLHKEPWRLHGKGCSGAIAVQLALAMGCTSIVLIGCDGCYVDGKTDFYGTNPFHSSATLANFRYAMQWVKNVCPVPIYNCGQSDLWERRTLLDVVQELKPPRLSRIEFFAKLKG